MKSKFSMHKANPLVRIADSQTPVNKHLRKKVRKSLLERACIWAQAQTEPLEIGR